MIAKYTDWHGKPYHSLDAWCKNTYGHKCYKIALDAHLTCPNRDGSKGIRGCIFCSAGGSGDFAVGIHDNDVSDKLEEGIQKVQAKLPRDTETHFIAYFQAFTNTYGPMEYLEKIYTAALSHPKVCGISIATRPDCLPREILDLLTRLKETYSDKFIWVELGLQTIHDKTATYIRRGYELPCFENAMKELKEREIPVIVHLILGLPGETKEQIYESVSYVNSLHPFGVKLQLLHILKGTDLETDYLNGKFDALDKSEYIELLLHCIGILSPEIVIHRLTGDGDKKMLLAPMFSANKKDVLNSIHAAMKKNSIVQGCLLRE